MTLRVKMFPRTTDFNRQESGIRRVIEAYEQYLPEHDVTFVEKDSPNFDLIVSHAAAHMTPDVLMCHGLYWTADYHPSQFEWITNSEVITAARHAYKISVPSSWVSEAFRRDMRLTPTVIPHGIEWRDWRHTEDNGGYVLFNKNRTYDVCNPEAVNILANMFPELWFVATFAYAGGGEQNIKRIGMIPHRDMQKTIQRSAVYLSTVKETFGIGVLEAMAAGIPVLGFEYGGNCDLVQHGVNGFLAKPGDYEGLAEGLRYCLKYRDTLGANGMEMVKKFTWESAAEQVAKFWQSALDEKTRVYTPKVTVVIPSYNYADKVGRAINSVRSQSFTDFECIVVDNNSTDGTEKVVKEIIVDDPRFRYVNCPEQGVAYARNYGVESGKGLYYCCLDADDAIEPNFLQVCVNALDKDRSLGVVYTSLRYIKPNGETGVSPWPGDFDFNAQLKKRNQVPTCHVGRIEMWKRMGGQRQRYAPDGAGAEDAELILRAGAYGWNMKKVTTDPLFIYSWMSGRVSGNQSYQERDWLLLHPWTKDDKHPFASVATPKNRISHPVRQYDEPGISVVVPVGPDHIKYLEDVLDSLDSQTYRKWEAIVVLDCEYTEFEINRLTNTYPFVRWVYTPGKRPRGAGIARNAGAKIARAPLLFFMDCDDALYPNTLQRLLDEYNNQQAIIYSDYVGKSQANEELRQDAERNGRLVSYDPKSGSSIFLYRSADYDCTRAVQQPDPSRMYIWNLISSLVPTEWHNELGGFDEKMVSWEDWDYWIRMARAGKCFTRVAEPLIMYRFDSGMRREAGLHDYQNLIEYLLNKYKGQAVMPCSTCPGKSGRPAPQQIYNPAQTIIGEASKMSDDNYALVSYNHPNLGSHKVIGPVTGVNYGYRGGGGVERMYVDRRDIAARPDLFVEVIEQPVIQKTVVPSQPAPILPSEQTQSPRPPARQPVQPPKAPEPVIAGESEAKEQVAVDIEETDLQKVPGVTNMIAIALNDKGYHTVGELKKLKLRDWMSIKGVGENRARTIVDFLKTV